MKKGLYQKKGVDRSKLLNIENLAEPYYGADFNSFELPYPTGNG